MENLLNNIISANSSIDIRLLMKNAGWSSHDSLTDLGWNNKYGYSIWFERWNWQGIEIYSKVCFHKHSDNLDNITEIVRGAAKLALKAVEEYKDSVPVQLVDDKLGENIIATKTFIEERNKLK